YHAGRKAKSKYRIINPYGIVHWNNNWYVVAFCNMRNEVRSFSHFCKFITNGFMIFHP
ncbi:WYL domain-containing protein, partial [Clostridioides difficile]